MAASDHVDESRWRATFGITYPTSTMEIINNKPNVEITGQKVFFSVKRKSLEGVRFITCQFFIANKTEANGLPVQDTLEYLTFRDCHFDRTFLGRVSFLNCRFVDCIFQCCDFGDSRFSECEFSDCRFSECTSWKTIFIRTLIDAGAFLRGQCVPSKNYQSVPPAEYVEARKKFIRVQAVIANQLVSSLANGNQSDFYDSALYYSKLYHYRLRRSQLTDWARYRRLTQSKFEATLDLLYDFMRMVFTGFNLLMTKGGTSVSRLLLAFVVLTAALFPCLVLPRLRLKFADNVSYCEEAAYHERVASSVELFLAFGYTNYTPQSVMSHVAITSFACIGLVWYAFLIPVLLRRVYK